MSSNESELNAVNAPSRSSCSVGGCDRAPETEVEVEDGFADVCDPCSRAFRAGVEAERRRQ